MLATLENTRFCSTAVNTGLQEYTYGIRKTAKYFGVPLYWLYWEETNALNVHDYIALKINPLLAGAKKLLQQGVEHLFFFDSRDVLFTAPVCELLRIYNTLDLKCVLFNKGWADVLYPYNEKWFRDKVAKDQELVVLNAGVFAGQINLIIKLCQHILFVFECLDQKRNCGHFNNLTKNDIASLYAFNYALKQQKRWDDQFCIHILQACGIPLIQVDRTGQLMSARILETGLTNISPIIHFPGQPLTEAYFKLVDQLCKDV